MRGRVFFNKRLLVLLILAVIIVSLIPIGFLIRGRIDEHHVVAVIEIYGEITSIEKRDQIIDMIDYSLMNETIKAVVLKIDCPGGYADAIQSIYYHLIDLKQEKPIVASIVGLGVSGGYHIAISADFIYVVPSAMVGNIGVVATLPEKVELSEEVVESGPYKLRGVSEQDFPFQVQSTLDCFLDYVETQRGDGLHLSRVDLSKGLIYMGKEAVQNGLADEIGSDMDAVKKAADISQIEYYSIVTVNNTVKKTESLYYWNQQRDRKFLRLDDLFELCPHPALYYIYVSPEGLNEKSASTTWGDTPPSTGESENKTVLIDYSHENAFAQWELNLLLYEVASRGFSIRYLNSTYYLEERLEEIEAFVIINPGVSFSDTEINSIKEYVLDDGKLLLITDPTRTNVHHMNTLSAEFGIVFAKGYLYNLEENYGNYKNIYLTKFEESEVTKGLDRLVFYTATYIHSTENAIAYTSEFTLSSESENPQAYSPMLLSKETVLALGDQTFLREPYCYIYDNYKLIQNISEFLTE